MGKFDHWYDEHVKYILENGTWDTSTDVRTKWADGTSAYTISTVGCQARFDNSELLIPTKKRLAWKSAIHEGPIWFYIKRTSDVTYLKENKVKIWDEWTRPDNTIGRAYGYQLGKAIPDMKTIRKDKYGTSYSTTNQIHQLLEGLKNNPASRRHITTLWDAKEIWDMALAPCWWNTQWLVKEGKLYLIVQSRSSDTGLGLSFNIFQYQVLLRMVAQVTGYEVGELICNISDAHIYDRHVEPLSQLAKRKDFPAPKLWINPNIEEFDHFTIDDFVLVHYAFEDEEIKKWSRQDALLHAYYEHGGNLEMEVAI
jgi:thymidylate synthase